MNSVYFANSEPLDLDFLRLMGVSIKETENPIGFFGTGLKYAIAVLLRTGHTVTLHLDEVPYHFTTRTKRLRGQDVQVIYMNDEQLSFSITLGRNWEVWMAFRELYSNTKDEGGVISHAPPHNRTVIEVKGGKFYDAYLNRAEIILEDEPLISTEALAIHRKEGRGADYLFYRGIRTNPTGRPARFNYNILEKMQLTEDRTIAASHLVQSVFARSVAQLEDEDILESILLAGQGSFEENIDFSWINFGTKTSVAFSNVVARHRFNPHLNRYALRVWRGQQPHDAEYEMIKLTPSEQAMLDEAVALLAKLDCEIDFDTVKFVRALGPDILGKYAKGVIYISHSAFEQGFIILAGTLYEEYLHAEYGYDDQSRSLQNYLLNKVITLADRAS